MPLLLSLLFSIFYFLFSREAFAWGPITHLDYANACLQNASAFAPAIRALLAQFPMDFLYGALAADITLGKDYVDYLYNCHNWRVGFLVLNEARDDRERACAYGYLSHLAVDIISHNFFVPYKTIFSYPTRLLGHVYWEMRFDARRPQAVWNLAKKLTTGDFRHDDQLFQRVLRRTIFSFKTNKRIINSMLSLHKFRHWKTVMHKFHEVSRFQLTDRDIEEYRQLALESELNFLKDPERAACTKVDPTGADKLLYAAETRRDLKRLTRKKIITPAQAEDFLRRAKSALREAIYHPRAL